MAKQNPHKLRELQDLFWGQAAPLQYAAAGRQICRTRRPGYPASLTRGRGVFTYYPGMPRIPEGSTPDVKNKSHTITAEIEIPQDGAYGILATQGGRL